MSVDQIANAAVLFFDATSRDAIPLTWFERVISVFGQFHMAPILFTAEGGSFQLDDCYTLDECGGHIVKWGEQLESRRDLLVDSLKCDQIRSLHLDTPRADAKKRSAWHVAASVSLARQKCFIGVDEELISDPSTLLQQAIEMTSDLFRLRYGFAYKMPLADEPDSYAVGIQRTTLSDFRQWLKRRKDGLPPPETPDELWHEELLGQRRHLKGLFRGAYPANILSEAHVQAADLNSAQIGRLSEIEDSLWLWELSSKELPLAESLLASKGALVSQAE